MSNNKQSRFEDLAYWKNNAEENYMTTPISVLKYIHKLEEHIETIKAQLPSDEEIAREASNEYQEQKQSYENSVEMFPIDFGNYLEVGFIEGAIWMRNKIQGGNK
jgi:hypothetical protein